jgi:hypothetical protein
MGRIGSFVFTHKQNGNLSSQSAQGLTRGINVVPFAGGFNFLYGRQKSFCHVLFLPFVINAQRSGGRCLNDSWFPIYYIKSKGFLQRKIEDEK